MIAKPKPTGNDVVDQWHLELWEAEKAQQDAEDALNNCPADASELELNEAKNNYRQSILKLDRIYDQLPYSDPDDRTENEALASLGNLTLKQAARCINNYLETASRWEIVDYTERLDRHDWYVDRIAAYQDKYPEKTVPHREIVGRVYIKLDHDPREKQPDRETLWLGYGKADGDAVVINPHTLTQLWRNCLYACADLADNIAKAEAKAEAEAKEAEAAGKSIFTKKNTDEAKEYWREIPHNNDDREIVRLWNKGLTAARIAEEIKKTQSHVENRIRILREEYPKYVLTDKVRKQFNFRDKS